MRVKTFRVIPSVSIQPPVVITSKKSHKKIQFHQPQLSPSFSNKVPSLSPTTTTSSRTKKKEGIIQFKVKRKALSFEKQLLDHQKLVVKHMLNHRSCLTYHGPGSGKTRIAVVLVALLKKPALVVVPASLKENFAKEIDKIEKESKTKIDRALFHIISSHTFLDFLPENCQDKLLIVDEAHELRNAEGKISKKVLACTERASKVLLMTGSPLVNRPSDIAPLINMCVKGHMKIEVGGWFRKRTFTEIPTGESFVKTFGEDGLNDLGKELWSKLFPCIFSYYLPPKTPDFPTMEMFDVMIPMDPQQLNVYEHWENQALTRSMIEMLSGKNISLLDAAITKLPAFRAYLDGGRRICNVVTVNGKIIAPKFEAMMKKLEASSGKAIIFSQFLSKGIEVIETMLREKGISYVKFTGKESENQKKAAVEAYNTDKVRVFLLSRAGGLGLDLKNTDTIHIMEASWNTAIISQAIFRGVRYKSHTDPHAVVKVYKYYCYKPSNYLGTIWKQMSGNNSRKKSVKLSADMYLLELSIKKEQANQQFLYYAIQHAMEQDVVCGIPTL